MFDDFLPHLEELRRRLLISLLSFCLLTLICFFFSHALLDFLVFPLTRYQEISLYFQKPYEAFSAHLKVSALAGFLASSPILITQAWLFLSPGLYPAEKRVLGLLALVTSGLFLSGALFAYYAVIPVSLRFLLSFQTSGLRPLLGMDEYFSFLTGMILIFGVLFNFPVVIFGLVRLGVVNPDALSRARRGVIVFLFVLAAVLTPSPDPVSQILLALPLVLLFEISLAISRRVFPGGRPRIDKPGDCG